MRLRLANRSKSVSSLSLLLDNDYDRTYPKRYSYPYTIPTYKYVCRANKQIHLLGICSVCEEENWYTNVR